MLYFIENEYDEAWCASWGWVDGDDVPFTIYNLADKETTTLPDGGHWVRYV